MAKRPAFTPDEARTYLASRGESIPKTDAQAQRKARGLSQGKTKREVFGHKVSEHQYRRTQATTIETSVTKFKKKQWAIGPTPITNSYSGHELGPYQQPRRATPQPDDILRMIRSHTSHRLINIGVFGYLAMYLSPDDPDDKRGWAVVHMWVQREWVIQQLEAMPRNHVYTPYDPAYLKFAHDLVTHDKHEQGYGDISEQQWQWTAIFQWTVRDGVR